MVNMIKNLLSASPCYMFIFVILLAGTSAPIFAVVNNENQKNKYQPTSLQHTTVNDNAVKKDESRRLMWSLSTKEWSRYKELMQGIRGSISAANISPIEVLGLHAKTASERRKYAEIWAKMMHEDIEKTIAFHDAMEVANNKLYPSEVLLPGFDIPDVKAEAFKKGDRVLVFVKIIDCTLCLEIVQKLLSDEQVNKLIMDIYFIDTKDKKDNASIRKWAKNLSLDETRLKTGSITLNHDNGNLYKITKKLVNKVPLVFSLNNKTITKIEY